MSNNVFNAEFNSFYEYIPKSSVVNSNIPEVLETVRGNALDFQEKFQKGDLLKEELNMIASELVTTAQYFGEQQGLTGSNLLDSKFLTATVKESRLGSGFIVEFKNTAQDKYNRYYAGHVEYGHYNKNRKGFVEARPFMRPALYSVSKASKGELNDVFSDFLSTIFRENGKGYQGISNLSFGKKLGQRDSRGLKSTQTVNLLKKGPKRWANKTKGRWGEFNEQANFEKSMKQWSVKRGLMGKNQIKQKRDAGFGRKGRSLGKAKHTAKYIADTQTQRAKDNAKMKEFVKDKQTQERVIGKLNNYYATKDRNIYKKLLKGKYSEETYQRLRYQNSVAHKKAINSINQRFDKKWRNSSKKQDYTSSYNKNSAETSSNDDYQKILLFREGKDKPEEVEVLKEQIGIKYIENRDLGGYLERRI